MQGAVQNSNINYIHVETPQAENNNNNDYKQFRSQKAGHKLTKFALLSTAEHKVCILLSTVTVENKGISPRTQS